MLITHRKNASAGLAVLGLLLLSGTASAQFSPLFRVGKGSGDFSVKVPGREFEPGIVNHAYPYGSEILVGQKGKVFVFLAPSSQIHFSPNSRFTLVDDPDVDGAKRIDLTGGSLETLLENDDESVYPLAVETPAARFDDIDGSVVIGAALHPAECLSSVKVIQGKVTMRAPQIPPTRVGTGVSFAIQTRPDLSYTEIVGAAGDFMLTLEHGSADPVQAPFGAGSRAKIWRKRSPVTQRMAVSMMVANADGAVSLSYAFTEGQSPVQNGLAQDLAGSAEDSSGEESADDKSGDAASSDADALGDVFGDSAPAAAPSGTTTSDDFSSFDFSF